MPAKTSASSTMTATDAHSLMITELIRDRTQQIRTAKREIAAHIARLQRASEALENDTVPYVHDRNVDDTNMSEALAKVAALNSAILTIRGYVEMINA